MDVRCERCRAQYVFDDDQVTPQGLTVQCTNCGHVFRVKKKELVVTVPVRPEDVTEQPILADAPSLRLSATGSLELSGRRPAGLAEPSAGRPAGLAEPSAGRPAGSSEPSAGRPAGFAEPSAGRPAADGPQRAWTIRQAGGATLDFTELDALQRWIVERRVTREDEVSEGNGVWLRLGLIGELQPFFDVVDAADRAGRAPPPPGAPPRTVARAGGTDFHPPLPFRPAGLAEPFGGRTPAPAAAPPEPTTELGAEALAAAGDPRSGRFRPAVVAVLLAAVGGAAYLLGPSLLGRDAEPPPAGAAAAPPVQPTPPEPAAAQPPPASPAPQPVSVAVPLTIELEQEPAAAAAPTAPKPPSPRALVAQARKLREGGEAGRALDLFAKALAARPDDVDALTGRGLCYFELGQYAPAEASFQRALQLDLEHPDAIMGLAETYRQQGKKAEALTLFERYLAVHPGGEEAAVARYAIGQLKE